MITVEGTDFTDAAEDIEFFLNDAEQTVVEATATSVKIRVDEVQSGLETNKIDLYFAIGIPDGYTELFAGATFSPVLLSLSLNEVSSAGSKI